AAAVAAVTALWLIAVWQAGSATERARRLTDEAPTATGSHSRRERRRERRRRGPQLAVDERTATVIVVLMIVLPLSLVVLHGLGLSADSGVNLGVVLVAA
ncbi:hypothetical protein, partial [Kitasatospora putterlickiae]|uniref:hypothetical protein n=1 Tax=Kitasatospora putterlickiae TaxID=221725 RepID=UPI0031DCA055